MYDQFKPTGPLKSSKPDTGGGNTREIPVFGIVKNNIDPMRMGRLQVFISDLNTGTDPDNSDNWVTVSYMSPFYGFVGGTAPNTGSGTSTSNPVSYGVWNSPPDIGTTVICIFINGDMNYGFYIGCVPEPEALRMVPAIGANFENEEVVFNEGESSSLAGATRVPVTNMNINNTGQADSNEFLNAPKPVHSYQASILSQQGLIRDPLRGPISSSAQRESPSRVGWGVSTPGRPIYQGGYTDNNLLNSTKKAPKENQKIISRRGGHTIVMDDGDIVGRDQLIRIRSSLGHQILMSDDGQTLFIIHANGQSYIELGKEGTIDMYSTNSFNVRTQGDLNLHADKDINIHATQKFNIYAEELNINTEQATNHKVGTDYAVETGGDYTHSAGGGVILDAGGDASLAGSTAYINGGSVNLNTGSTGTATIAVSEIPKQAHTDTLYDSEKGFAAAPGQLESITSRAPAHTPWANAGQGVDVDTSLDADDNLPEDPSDGVDEVNVAANSIPTEDSVSVATMSTVPSIPAVSTSLDKNSTSALMGAMSTSAATGVTASAVSAGAGIVQKTKIVTGGFGAPTLGAEPLSLSAPLSSPSSLTTPVVVVGLMGQSPEQMEAGGVLKPGSAKLVNSLVQGGANLSTAMPNNLFTGFKGVNSLDDYINSTEAQTAVAVNTLQQSQSGLIAAGVITGKESPTAISGLILSGATHGVEQTIKTVKTITGGTGTGSVNVNIQTTPTPSTPVALGASIGPASLGSVIGSKIGGNPDAVMKSISSGNFAAGLSQNVTGAMGAISGAVSSMTSSLTGAGSGIGGLLDSAKGVVGSAFSAITGAFKKFTPGIPQNIKSIVGGPTDSAGGLSLPSPASLASGISNLPGGSLAVSAINQVNGGSTGLSLPGTDSIKSLINNSVTAVTNGTSVQNSLNSVTSMLPGNMQGAVAGASNLVSNGLSSLTSGKTSLTSLATSSLPAGASAALNSAIAGVSSLGASPIQIPKVGLDTINRSSLTSQISNILGDKKIPPPNFSGSTSMSAASYFSSETAKLEEKEARKNKIRSTTLKAQEDAFNAAIANANAAKETYPAGDPEIDKAIGIAKAEYKKLMAIYDEISAIDKEA